ncbi:conserved hypothetical protein [Uncinocarpus reesii 1704]|uniref:Nucleoporin Pom152 n=1 Tax=Uncinocarpus reesii (strain UAMH 1704) TaxID=336963 RepID=C4JWP5_UNCRE|nr:uncharacterized protein UREG_06987 [Uncinocarpus reesii 1704]EEP82122.1 conserved hypothetical protein [Uncinocarpus reesii 1704]
MPDTPRLRSAFPQTPRTSQQASEAGNHHDGTLLKPSDHHALEQKINKNQPQGDIQGRNIDKPLISFDVIDAPAQRLYVVAFYVFLNAWRLYEYCEFSDDLDSTWLFLKWLSIDAFFLFGLPTLRIPWLEWAFSTSLAVFMLHAVANVFLMFHIPVALLHPFTLHGPLTGFIRFHSAPGLEHSSRSAILNPERHAICLGEWHPTANLPIRINQTTPVAIELLRIDLESGLNETISISHKLAKQLKRQSDIVHGKYDHSSHRELLYPVKKTGIYRLQKVVDESHLEVHRKSQDTLVVPCPRATILESPVHKCRGQLSNLTLEITGTAPLKIKYSRMLNDIDHGVSYRSIQPESLVSQFTNDSHPSRFSTLWAKTQKINIPLNESLNEEGEWIYSVDEVHDGRGNLVNYTSLREKNPRLTQHGLQSQRFFVHGRPRVSFTGCNPQTFLNAAKGDSVELPIHFHSAERPRVTDPPFTLGYSFTENPPQGSQAINPEFHEVVLSDVDNKPRIERSGWYNVVSISSQFCHGDVLEPSLCFLHNPPEPELSIQKEFIYDKCANHSVGLSLDLDLIGTPPFKIRYSIEHSRGIQTKVLSVDGLRGHLDLAPVEAGHYKYHFLDISDRVYESRSLKEKIPTLEQNVKPPASAQIVGPVTSRKACFGEPITVDLLFLGEAPWELQYELIHNGKRAKYDYYSATEASSLTIERLVEGGEYTLGLVSVIDKSNCKRPLNEEVKIEARAKRPSVAFGQVDRKRSILALEDKQVDLPLRLEGEAPWRVRYRHADKEQSTPTEKVFWNENSFIQVNQPGAYELLNVDDATCPGSIDYSAHLFNVSWIPRPYISAIDGNLLEGKNIVEKREVCEGDEDTMDIQFRGTPPYTARYEQQCDAHSGVTLSSKSLTAALNSAVIRMETSNPGVYAYKFTNIGDNLYSLDHQKTTSVTVTQRVNPRPSAQFQYPSRNYGFCKEDGDGEEAIPIVLEGVPPFALEIGIRHHSNSKPDVLSIPNIKSRLYNLPVPRRYLDLGQHVITIRKVRDARGCVHTTEYDGSSVRVTISDVPTIIPLESKTDYCVGERLSFSLSGHAPFEVHYTFNDVHRKATSRTTSFRRIAEKPGEFTITAVSDGASGKCKAHKHITKIIHEMPSVRMSQGRVSIVDIHEGGGTDILFEFGGTPPFEFTYTRSSNTAKGSKPQILDTKHDISYEHTKTIRASDEGTYEVVAIKDKFCSFSTLNEITTGRKW